MFRPFGPARVAAIALAFACAVAPLIAEEATLRTETSLRDGPDSEGISAFLTPGVPLEVVERRDGWVRVRLEGWVREETVVTEAAPSVAPALTAPPAAIESPAATTVEGFVRVKLKAFGKKSTAGMSVLLVPASVGLESSSSDPARLDELAAEAARLDEAAGKAMHKNNFREASKQRDELVEERDRVLGEWRDLIAADHGRREQEARAAAVAATTTDAKGWYSLATASAGDYTLYARFSKGKLDLEWIEAIDPDGGMLRIDLEASSSHGVPPQAD